MYFEKFPLVEYDGQIIHDISVRFIINTAVRDSVVTYELYRLSEGEKPEDVSYRIYGSVNYHWVILLMNDITDPLDEWFRTDSEMDSLLTQLYGAGKEDDDHHYEDIDGYVIGSIQGGNDVTISNRVFEEAINDARREIKVLRKDYLFQLINEFETSLNV